MKLSKLGHLSEGDVFQQRRIIDALKQARGHIEELQRQQHEPIAVVGIGCRFPGGVTNPETFWQLLQEGKDGITDIPPQRWDIERFYDADPEMPGKMYTRRGGFIQDVDLFDPDFFGISPREARAMDPQQRLLLEVSWEALEHAGIAPDSLQGSLTGTFLGIGMEDYADFSSHSGDATRVDAYNGLGNNRGIAAGRVSYVLGIQGPTLFLDTTCSSSILSVHLACQSLRTRECHLALAGGVNLMLSPIATVAYSKLRALAPDGYSKTFDASADGFVRGEGCGIVILKRLTDAIAANDVILACIQGSATNHDGRSNGLTAPNGMAQEAVLKKALSNARVKPQQIHYVEAHGTGTALGDPIEMLALGNILGQNRSSQQPLFVGSVKTNFGHLEAAAGIAGLIKVVLSLHHQQIPPNLHFKTPNPFIPWEHLPVQVPTTLQSWPTQTSPALAGVSSFGMSGSNVHIILSDDTTLAQTSDVAVTQTSFGTGLDAPERPLHIFTLTATSEAALFDLADCYGLHLEATPDLALADVCYSANTGRSQFNYRLACVSNNIVDLCQALQRFRTESFSDGVSTIKGIHRSDGGKRQTSEIGFLFTGQGSQYVGMARELYQTQPTFRKALNRCAKILTSYLDIPLLEIVYPKQELLAEQSLLDSTIYTQPALFAVEYALFCLWQSWGIQPNVVLGHSVGEYVAACVAGVFSLEDGLKLVAIRGRLMQQLPAGGGGMLSILATVEQIKVAIAPHPDITIAAINGPESTVISGSTVSLQAVQARLEEAGIKVKRLPVSHAFHSPLMEPMLAQFRAVAQTVQYTQPNLKLISNITGQAVTETVATPEYWCQHVLSPVNFIAGMASLQEQRCTIFLECGPKPTLLGMGKTCLPDNSHLWLPSLRPGQSDWQQLLNSLGALYVQGVKVDWQGFDRDYPQRRKIHLPTYPFQRQRYWVDLPPIEDPEASSDVLKLLQTGQTQTLLQKLQNGLPNAEQLTPEQVLEQLTQMHQQQIAHASLAEILFQVNWQLQPRIATTPLPPGQWLILGERSDLALALEARINQQGHHCQWLSPETYADPTAVVETLKTQLTQLLQQSDQPFQGVLYLGGWDTPSLNVFNDLSNDRAANDETHQINWIAHLQQSLQPLLTLLQVTRQLSDQPPQLWVLTRQAQMVLDTELVAVNQTPLWGFGRVAALEHPELWGGLLDLDPGQTEHQLVQHIVDEILQTGGALQVAYRQGKRYIPVLAKAQSITSTTHIQPDVSYLISGGLGSLGLKSAQRLVERGARHLVLLGRKGVSTDAQQQAITQLEALGARIQVMAVDVGQWTQLQTAWASLPITLPPLRGVIHAAGVLDDGLLINQQWEKFATVIAPKVQGGWNLHRLTQKVAPELDFFICFSSAAALVGSVAQGNYATANAFLDGLCVYRQNLGLPGLSLNWSAWSEVGMAAEMAPALKHRWANMGIKLLQVEQGLLVLEQQLGAKGHLGVLAVDWEVLRQWLPIRSRAFLAPVMPAISRHLDSVSTKGSDLLQRLQTANQQQQRQLLQDTLQAEVARLLGISNPATVGADMGFFDLGMDSLMAVELRVRLNRLLGVEISSTAAFDYPNIVKLIDYLTLDVLQLQKQSVSEESSGNSFQSLVTGENALKEPIAIIGLGCRLPGGVSDPNSFWQMLKGGVSTRSEIPSERWDVNAYCGQTPAEPGKMITRYGHFVNPVDQFDPGFFGISPREAIAMDPQHRLLLEVSWEALERAGHVLERLSESPVGVFVGSDGHDYEQLLLQHLRQQPASPLAAYLGTGTHIASAAGRLAYTLGFTGPTMTIDTACSSSLVAVHQACNSLRLGECQMALAGGVKLHLTPATYIGASQAKMLSADGHCKTFDIAADGYGRGEGCGMVVLKRLTDAQRDGDSILALIRGSMVNQDGPSSGLTVPNGQAQKHLMRQALARAQVQPSEISYLEAHGTGTSLGDPIEVNAAVAVLGQARSSDMPLWLGSVKTNIGHLEAAAGISALIKVVLSLQHRQIPAHLHLSDPNPKINWQPWLHVPKTTIPWETEGCHLAGISSFGFTGTNAHVVLAEAPPQPASLSSEWERPIHVLTLAAKSREALAQLAQRYDQHFDKFPELCLADVCFAANTGRMAHQHRLSVVSQTVAELKAELKAFSMGQTVTGLVSGQIDSEGLPKVAVLFTGQGSQYPDMGRELYETQPVFKQALEHCADILMGEGIDLVATLYGKTQDNKLDQTAYTQPALFALEYALYRLWQSWGIEPEAVMGHSVGEYVAACVAGVFSVADGLKLVAARGQLMQRLPIAGKMVSLLAAVDQIKPVVEAYPDVAIAAINGPQSTVISGASAAIEAVVQQLEATGIKCKFLAVSHPFHSPLMQPMIAEFETVAQQVTYAPPNLTLISNVTGQVVTTEIATAAYWCRHILSPVNFVTGIETLAHQDYEVFLECGPTPVLLGMGRQCLDEAGQLWLPSLRHGQNDWQQLLTSLGELYVRGLEIDWLGFDQPYPQRQKVSLPTYPFQRQRYWVDVTESVPGNNSGSVLNQVYSHAYPLIAHKRRSPLSQDIFFETYCNTEVLPFLADHLVHGHVVAPGAFHLALLLVIATQLFPNRGCELSEVFFTQALVIPEGKTCTLQTLVTPQQNTLTFQVISFEDDPSQGIVAAAQPDNYVLHATGGLSSQLTRLPPVSLNIQAIQDRCAHTVEGVVVYQNLSRRKMQLGDSFHWIERVWVGEKEVLGRLRQPEVLQDANCYPLHTTLVDAFLHLQAIFDMTNTAASNETLVPFKVERFSCQYFPDDHVFDELWCYSQLRPDDSAGHDHAMNREIWDIQVTDTQGREVACINGFEVKKASSEDVLRSLQPDFQDWLYEIQWQVQELAEKPTPIGNSQVLTPILNAPAKSTSPVSSPSQWLLFTPSGELGEQIQQTFQQQGYAICRVSPGLTYQQLDTHHYQLNPLSPQHFRLLLQELGQHTALTGIIHFWSMTDTLANIVDAEALQQAQTLGCGSVLHLVQAMDAADLGIATPLYLVTIGAQSVQSQQTQVQAHQAPLWGLSKTILQEYSQLSCCCIDLDPDTSLDQNLAMLMVEITTATPENQVAYRHDYRHVARLQRYRPHHLSTQGKESLTLPDTPAFQLKISEYGSLDNLSLQPLQRRQPEKNEVEIQVKAVGLNFRDVLNALGLLKEHYAQNLGITSADQLTFGLEAVGVISAIGENVSGWQIGDRVMTLAHNGFSSYIVCDANFIVSIPPGLSFEEAATLPLTFSTAYYGLCYSTEIQPGERLLIHAAAGGVGQAAVQLAQQAGAEVFATASPPKWEFLRNQGIQHVMNSRTLEFAREITTITQGKGVDIVFNSLNGECISKSFDILSLGGRFVEIGKLETWSQQQVQRYRSDAQYYLFDLVTIMSQHPQVLTHIWDKLGTKFEHGQLKPLHKTVFPIEQATDAFRLMQKGQHLGKVVVTIPQPSASTAHPILPIQAKASYLIAGGLGVLGLQVAQWLATQGAQQLVLMGRRQPTTVTQTKIQEIQNMGTNVLVWQADITHEQAVADVLSHIKTNLLPLKGVIQAAGVLEDSPLQTMSWHQFTQTLTPKLQGTWHLHQLTQNVDLDFFVCFSSIAALMGNASQGNYAAANAFLDALMEHRRYQNLPGVSIQWGPWASGGMAANLMDVLQERMQSAGVQFIPLDQGCQVMGNLLTASAATVAVMPVNWSQFSQQRSAIRHPLFEVFLQPVDELTQQVELMDELQSLSLMAREQRLTIYIQQEIARVLGIAEPASIEPRQRLFDLGLDSLMAVELRNHLQVSLGQSLRSTLFFDFPTLESLANYLAQQIPTIDESVALSEQYKQPIEVSLNPVELVQPIQPEIDYSQPVSKEPNLEEPDEAEAAARILAAQLGLVEEL